LEEQGRCDQERICEQKFMAIEDKFKTIHHRIDGVEEKTDNLTSINETLVELRLLSEQNIKSNKSRDEMLKGHSESLIQVTNTLTNMNKQFEITDEKIENLKIDVAKIDDDNSIKLSEIIKNILYVIAGIGATLIANKLFGITIGS